MDEMTEYLKARDLAEQTGLPEKEVKRLLRSYGEFFTPLKQGRSRVYPPEAAGLLTQIAELEAVGTTVPTIRGILRGTRGAEAEEADPSSVVLGGLTPAAAAGESLTLGALSDIKALQEELGELRAEVALLREKLGEHEQKIIGHQQQIRLLRHDVDDGRTEALARKMEGRSTPVWRRLFPGKGALRR
jgi:DNA-binding transcriptional MerR regulator